MKPTFWKGIWAICWIATVGVMAKRGRYILVPLPMESIGSVVRLDTWTGHAEQALFLLPDKPVIVRTLWDGQESPVKRPSESK